MKQNIRTTAKEMGLIPIEGPIQPGDTYLAERNTGPKLLTCLQVKNNYVVPVELAYCYDVWECVKVEA